ncbi:unnamed protein product [Discula destructiva]
MEVTPTFNELLKARQAAPTRQIPLSLAKIDAFLQTASSINREITSLHHELSSIRQAYLSTAAAPRKTRLQRSSTGSDSLRHGKKQQPQQQQQSAYLTDADRNVIDREAKDMLRALSARIHVLTQEEVKRQEAAAAAIKQAHGRGLSRALTGWAAGGGAASSTNSPEHAAAIDAEKQVVEHRGGVIMYLQEKLQGVAALQRGMMETRLAREMEKNRSVLAKARRELPPGLAHEFGFAETAAVPSLSSSGVPLQEEEESHNRKRWEAGGAGAGAGAAADMDLTDEQRQMFERDNQDMLRHYNSATEKVKTVEKSLVEIAELQSVLVSNLSVQSANIEQLVADSDNTAANVGGGNKQLKKATDRKFSPARMTFYGASALCTFLILWDLII